MQALWGEPWTARSVFVDGNEVMTFRGYVIDLWLLAKQCTVQWSLRIHHSAHEIATNGLH